MNEEMTKEMTVEDVLKDCVETLDNLKITMNQIDELGFPISRVSINLKNCITAIERSKMMEEAKENSEEDDAVEIVEVPSDE